MTSDYVLPSATLLAHERAIRAVTREPAWEYAVDLEDPDYGRAFRYFLLFSDPGRAHEAGFAELDERRAFYNSYYWFKRFVRRHGAKHGVDAGLEQQAFALLEAAPAGVDWTVVELIDSLADRDLPAW